MEIGLKFTRKDGTDYLKVKKFKRKIKEEQKHKHLNVSSGLTSLCRLMKHLTRSPPIEWVIMFILFSPAAVYIDSNFSARRFNVSWNLKEQMNYLTRTRNHHNVGIDNGENTFLVTYASICDKMVNIYSFGQFIWRIYLIKHYGIGIANIIQSTKRA